MPTAISITRGVFQLIGFSLLTETGKPYERSKVREMDWRAFGKNSSAHGGAFGRFGKIS
jgi:hypothetical protein